MAPGLDAKILLAKAGRYSNPANEADILPVVIGDHASGSGFGLLPTVEIDTVNHVFLVADHAVGSLTNVYVDGVEQVSGFTTSVSNNYEGQGSVATITFSSDPGGAVTARGEGLQDAGSTVESWADAVVAYLRLKGGFKDGDFDQTELARSRSQSAAGGYEMAWVFAEERTAKEWLTTLMAPVLGSHDLGADGRVRLFVHAGRPKVDLARLVGHVVATRDVKEGSQGVHLTYDAANLVNSVSARWGWNFAESKWMGAEDNWQTALSEKSQNLYGEVRREHLMKGLKDEAAARKVAEIILDIQPEPVGVATFKLEHMKGFGWSPGDLFGFTWMWGPDELDQGMVNRIFRVEAVSVDLARLEAKVTASETGYYLAGRVFFDAAVKFDASKRFGAKRDLTVYA